MSRFRIRRADKRNWVIERYQEGGEAITRGRYVGREKQSKWDTINPVGYFPTLADAAKRVLDEELGAEWPEDGWEGANLLEAVKAAEGRTLAIVTAALEEREAVAPLDLSDYDSEEDHDTR